MSHSSATSDSLVHTLARIGFGTNLQLVYINVKAPLKLKVSRFGCDQPMSRIYTCFTPNSS